MFVAASGCAIRPLALALLLAVSAVPQGFGRQAQAPVFSVATDLVHVTVSVRDGDGDFVGDLTAADFALYENGKPQKVELFARAVEPGQEQALALNLGLLLDTSESMLEQLRLSQEAAIRFLDNIPRARDLITIFFDQDIRLSRYNSENQQGLIERILEAKGGGNTALYDAIAVYLSRVSESEGRKVLVVLSDGEDSTSSVAQSELNELVRSSGVTIYPIAFTRSFAPGSSRGLRSKAFLLGLAEATGGQVFSPHASRDLADVYKQILDELSAQYVLGFNSSDGRRDGKFRKLKVSVKGKGLKVRHRSGYRAPRA